MSAMSASPVKPILPPSGVTSSPPKVTPPNATSASISPNITPAACNIPGSPLKHVGLNHNAVSLNLISENKVTASQPASVTVPSVQALPRTPEKPKEVVPSAPPPLNNVSPKVTSNGVPPVVAPVSVAAPVSAQTAAPVPMAAPISTPPAPAPAPASAPAPVPASNVSLSNLASGPKHESPAKPDVVPVKPVLENHAAAVPPPSSVAAPSVPKSEPASIKSTPPAHAASQPENKKESPLPETKPGVKADAKTETKTSGKAEAVSTTATPAKSILTTSSKSASVTPTAPSTTATSEPASTVKTPVKAEETASKTETKAATVPRTPKRKPEPKVTDTAQSGSEERKSKRTRLPTQPYQSPLPELTLITKLVSKSTPTKKEDDKLIVFYKNEFLAVRNAEGGFYVCQSMQNIYRSSSKIRIRWLSQDSNGVYIPDFYDHSDFECILTSLSLDRVDKDKWKLPEDERLRTENILKRALDVEKGVADKPSVTEEHPDGLDLSLFKDESQLKKSRKSTKKAATKSKTEVATKKDKEPESPAPKAEESSNKRTAPPPVVKTKKATPAKKVTPARNPGAAAKSQTAAKKPAETKKVAVKRKAPKAAAPSTSYSSLTPAEKRRKVIENLTKQVSTNERSTKTRSAGGAVAAKISSAALKMVITKDRDRRNIAAARKK